MLSTKTKKILAVVAFILAFLVTRLPFLGYDEINPDAVNWHLRSEQFIVGLKGGDFIKTYQHYHPGVTLMWTMGVPIELYRQLNPQDRIYTQDNFIIQHQIAKYSLVTLQLGLTLVLIYGLKKLFGLNRALLGVSLFTFEPWFLGNARLLHMDTLLALFMVLAMVFSFCGVKIKSTKYLLVAGIFAGLAFLTKSVGLLSFAALPLAVMLDRFTHRQESLKIGFWSRRLGMFLLATVATIFILFPALWVNPKFVLGDIYNEGLRIGTRRGHEQVVLGEAVDVAGPKFYPIVLALKTSPVIWLGLGLLIVQLIKNRNSISQVDRQFLVVVTIFYTVYFVGMSVVSKKIDRYMVPLLPWLGFCATVGFTQAWLTTKKPVSKVALKFSLVLVTGIGLIYPLVKLYPYYFTYTNPIFGPAEKANRIVGQKPFGLGIWELKNRLTEKYGDDLALGFIDRKPMSMIYPNSKLFDIRETGTSKYDLIILGPNEQMPKNVTGGKYKFAQDDAMYINGLEFWRIYRKVEDND